MKKLRLTKEVRAVDLIARLGAKGWDVTAATYSKIESGQRILADTELMMILNVLRCQLDDLK